MVTRGGSDFHCFTMPPKRKDNNSTSTASGSGPKPKRSKPTFRTPTSLTADVSGITNTANQLSSTNNRVVTLRTGASGRRGYRTQELAAASSSNTTQANDTVDDYEHILSADHDITNPEIQNDTPAASKSKGRSKQKNTTTVSQWYCYMIYTNLYYVIV